MTICSKVGWSFLLPCEIGDSAEGLLQLTVYRLSCSYSLWTQSTKRVGGERGGMLRGEEGIRGGVVRGCWECERRKIEGTE